MRAVALKAWTYEEWITANYARAQSLMHQIYGHQVQETGHKTFGHSCVTEEDKAVAAASKASLLYGELLPRGVNAALSPERLDAGNARTVFDLGMGTGKVPIQTFLQFPNLSLVRGVEISTGRFAVAERAALDLVRLLPDEFEVQNHVPGRKIVVGSQPAKSLKDNGSRRLELICGDMLDTAQIDEADIVMIETEVSGTSV